MSKVSLLIDGDEYLFKACAAVEREVRWDDWNHVLYANRGEAWANFQRMLDQLFERFETREHALTFSAPPCFRLAISPTYKGGRTTRKPLCYADLRDDCDAHYNTISFPGLEADDVMGILATKPPGFNRIIVSQDKDMKTIPCSLLREGKVVHISEAEANYNHLYQTLIGDVTDGFKGCPGVGPVAAEKLLAKPVWPTVVTAYEKAKLTEEDALVQARLARILRWSDWDSDLKQPILWRPSVTSDL